jgi:hypothetical protein
LKIEFTYGVRLNVPLVGRLGVWLMRIIDGCAPTEARRLGALALGEPERGAAARAWTCAFYDARDDRGRPSPRWPVRVAAGWAF